MNQELTCVWCGSKVEVKNDVERCSNCGSTDLVLDYLNPDDFVDTEVNQLFCSLED